jgi:oligopeptide/dipeptide ABC transporter ATP-binding protein
MTVLLELDGLMVRLPIGRERRAVLRGVDLSVSAGEAVGIVGESGSGKSMTLRAIARLLPPGAEVSGALQLDGNDIAALRGEPLRQFRRDVAMIFQDPRAHINPVRRIGDFLTEAVIDHGLMNRRDARRRALELLDAVRIDRPEHRLDQYPHELSGGMLQRVMIASALMGMPRLLLADEPTTALDVTTQAEVMAIIDEQRRDRGLAMLFVTHDLELAGAICDRTAVMYAGEIVELNDSRVIDTRPLHPYTAALVRSRPRIDVTARRLDSIPGHPLAAIDAPDDSCAFADRCGHVVDACRSATQVMVEFDDGQARCHRAEELQATLEVSDG